MDLSIRVCKLGINLNVPSEMHGDERVAAVDIPLVGILLEKEEVNELVGDKFWNAIFDTPIGDGKAPRAAWPDLDDYRIAGKFACSIAIELGENQNDIELEEATISKIRLKPLDGGLTQMSCSVHTSANVERFIHKLTARIDTEIKMELAIGEKLEREKSKQAELPLNSFGNGEEANGHDEHAAAGEAQAEALARSKPAGKRRGRPATH